jgi:hypothetical protein
LATPASAQFASDTFLRGADAALQSHAMTGGPAGSWTKHSNFACTTNINVEADSDTAFPLATSETCVYYASPTPPDASYDVQADLVVVSDADAFMGVICRMNTSGNLAGYQGRHDSVSNLWEIVVSDGAGGETQLGTFAQTTSAGNTYTVKLSCIGSAIKLSVNGVERISVTNSTISSAGQAGVIALYFTGANSAVSGEHFDNFSATDTTAAVTAPPGCLLLRVCP